MVLAAVLLTIGVMGGGYFLLPALFGSEYRSSLLPFVILTASFPFLALSRLLGPVYAAYDLVWPLLAINVGCGAANILLNLLLIPLMDVHGAAIATSLCYGIQAFCAVAYLVWRLQVTGQEFIFLGVPNVALAVLIVVLDSPVGVLFGTVCALAIWAVLAWRCRPQSDEDRQFIAGIMLPSSFARARRILLRA
jgi:O-antigen/teichoic acid export membrane protein